MRSSAKIVAFLLINIQQVFDAFSSHFNYNPPRSKNHRRHIVDLPFPDWELGLREATYQALLRENNLLTNLRRYIYVAPMLGRQEFATPFGDIAILARGQLYSAPGGFQFVQDPYQNDCDGCHNSPPKCDRSPCENWRPEGRERLLALWTVKRIRHRDPNYGYNYELEYRISPMNVAVGPKEPFITRNGRFDYGIPGHVFVAKSNPRPYEDAVQRIDQRPGKFYRSSGYSNTYTSNQWSPYLASNRQYLPPLPVPPPPPPLPDIHEYFDQDPRKSGYPNVLYAPPEIHTTTTTEDDDIDLFKNFVDVLTTKKTTTFIPPTISPPQQNTSTKSLISSTTQNNPVYSSNPTTPNAVNSFKTTRTTTSHTHHTIYSEPDPLYTSSIAQTSSTLPQARSTQTTSTTRKVNIDDFDLFADVTQTPNRIKFPGVTNVKEPPGEQVIKVVDPPVIPPREIHVTQTPTDNLTQTAASGTKTTTSEDDDKLLLGTASTLEVAIADTTKTTNEIKNRTETTTIVMTLPPFSSTTPTTNRPSTTTLPTSSSTPFKYIPTLPNKKTIFTPITPKTPLLTRKSFGTKPTIKQLKPPTLQTTTLRSTTESTSTSKTISLVTPTSFNPPVTTASVVLPMTSDYSALPITTTIIIPRVTKGFPSLTIKPLRFSNINLKPTSPMTTATTTPSTKVTTERLLTKASTQMNIDDFLNPGLNKKVAKMEYFDGDLFGSDEKTSTKAPEKNSKKVLHTKDIDDIFGSSLGQNHQIEESTLPSTQTTTLKIIYSDFYSLSTDMPTTASTIETDETTTFDVPNTSVEFTTLSFENDTIKGDATDVETYKETTVKNIETVTDASDNVEYRTMMPTPCFVMETRPRTNSKKEFDALALSLVNHAKSIDYLHSSNEDNKNNNNDTRNRKYKRKRMYKAQKIQKRN